MDTKSTSYKSKNKLQGCNDNTGLLQVKNPTAKQERQEPVVQLLTGEDP